MKERDGASKIVSNSAIVFIDLWSSQGGYCNFCDEGPNYLYVTVWLENFLTYPRDLAIFIKSFLISVDEKFVKAVLYVSKTFNQTLAAFVVDDFVICCDISTLNFMT